MSQATRKLFEIGLELNIEVCFKNKLSSNYTKLDLLGWLTS